MSVPINDGGPAYPTPTGTQHNDGPTLRDYFAAAALPVAWKAYESFAVIGDNPNQEISKSAYQIADAMLKTREALGKERVESKAKEDKL